MTQVSTDHFPIGYGPIPYSFGISLDGCIYYNADAHAQTPIPHL